MASPGRFPGLSSPSAAWVQVCQPGLSRPHLGMDAVSQHVPLVQKGQGSGPRRRLARRSGWRRASPREGQGATHQGPLEQGGPPEQRGDPSTAPRGSLLPQAPAMCPQSSLPEPQFTISACHFCIVRPLSHWLLRIHCHPYLLPCSHSGAEGICLPGPQVDSRYTEGRAGRKDERGQQTRTPTQL